ncbi:MAG: tripartite tricarboxylate transporter substrate binding protein [Desulfovibrionaceae bacterium]|nr:tripartite tricarboxylate transporter substrate binding protein [Desulfovibrionaceae bacterium]
MAFFINRRRLLATAASAAAAAPLSAWAEQASFATRPVRMVVPFAAGGATDIIARVLGKHLAETFGQAVIVDNKPGASGLISGETVVRAPADGLTVLMGSTTTMLTNKYLFTKTSYDPLTDLLPISRVCTAPLILTVTSDAPASDMKEFMAWIKANKGKLSYGTYGIGSHAQLVFTTLSEMAGADMTHVAYKGEAPMAQSLLGDNIKIGMGSFLTLKPYFDSGKLRPLAVTGGQRVPLLQHVPTFAEAGYASEAASLVGWLAIAVPKGLPADIAKQWEKAVNRAVTSREGKARIIASGFVPADDDTLDKFGKDWASEGPLWGKLLKQAGVQPS